jgi:ketosteroid isomerase-like protein
MTRALPQAIAEYLDTPEGKTKLDAEAIWFRWNLQTRQIESSGRVLKSTPEQMSRPRTAVFLRGADGLWKRYA